MTPIDAQVIDSLDTTSREILALVAIGLPNRDIAERMCLSYQTVRNRVSHLLDATGAINRTQLALRVWLGHPDCRVAACQANPAAPLSPEGRVGGDDPPR